MKEEKKQEMIKETAEKKPVRKTKQAKLPVVKEEEKVEENEEVKVVKTPSKKIKINVQDRDKLINLIWANQDKDKELVNIIPYLNQLKTYKPKKVKEKVIDKEIKEETKKEQPIFKCKCGKEIKSKIGKISHEKKCKEGFN